MTDDQLLMLTLKALGGVQQGGLQGQLESMAILIKRLQEKRAEIVRKLRVEEALKTSTQRLPKDHPRWGVHMTHCYEGEEDGHHFTCKYGDDEICPAAMYEFPFQFWKANKLN